MTTVFGHNRLDQLPPFGAQFYCLAQTCPAKTWRVERQPGALDLWLITEAHDANRWLVAASLPICPLCATDLVLMSLS